MAAAEPTAAPAKQAPELSKLFPTKKKNFKGTNFTIGGNKDAPKKKAAAAGDGDEWDEEKLANEKLKVAVQVEALTVEGEVEAEKATWKVGKAVDTEAEQKTTNQFPSLAKSFKPAAAVSSGPAARVEGITGVKSTFDALDRPDEEDSDGPPENAAAKGAAAAKKAEKKEAKRLEKERRDKEEAEEKAKAKEAGERVVLVGGVPDTQIKADLDAIQAKYDGRRKRPVAEED